VKYPEHPTPILVLAATAAELAPLRGEASAPRPAGRPVPTCWGSIGGNPVILAVTGVGKSCAAFAAGHLLASGEFRGVVNIGCAGAFPDSGLAPGEVVIATGEILADEGALVGKGFLDLEQLALPAVRAGGKVFNRVRIRLPCRLSAGVLEGLAGELGFPLQAGPLCTVSTTSGTSRRAGELSARWHPLAESMEGAAVALAARLHSLPLLEVRGISNFTGTRDRRSWDIPLAASRAAAAAAKLIVRASSWRPASRRRRETS